MKSYNKIRKDTKTNIIATQIHNINQTFVSILIGVLPLGNIIYYPYGHN